MARKKEDSLVTEGDQSIADQPEQSQNITLTPEQVNRMSAQQTADLINSLQQKQNAQNTQLLGAIFQGLTQQNGAAGNVLSTLLQVGESQRNSLLQTIITDHYAATTAGQQEATASMIDTLKGGQQVRSDNFLRAMGLQQSVTSLGEWQSETAARDALPTIPALVASESTNSDDADLSDDRRTGLEEPGF